MMRSGYASPLRSPLTMRLPTMAAVVRPQPSDRSAYIAGPFVAWTSQATARGGAPPDPPPPDVSPSPEDDGVSPPPHAGAATETRHVKRPIEVRDAKRRTIEGAII